MFTTSPRHTIQFLYWPVVLSVSHWSHAYINNLVLLNNSPLCLAALHSLCTYRHLLHIQHVHEIHDTVRGSLYRPTDCITYWLIDWLIAVWRQHVSNLYLFRLRFFVFHSDNWLWPLLCLFVTYLDVSQPGLFSIANTLLISQFCTFAWDGNHWSLWLQNC